MKVLIILADNVYLTPYIHKYLTILNEMNIEYYVIYWDKNENEVIQKDNFYRFSYQSRSRIMKFKGYLDYRKKICRILKENNITFVISLHQIVSLLLSSILLHRFKNNFIYDIRDYSYERFYLVRKLEKKLVQFSRINVISSEGYKKFLPKSHYYITHNVPFLSCEKYKQLENTKNSTVQISYIGLIRFMEQNKKIIDFFKNDKRFHLNFIGTNAEKLKDYCIQNKVNNVTLIGTFSADKTLDFYKETDLIMNLYGNNTPLLDYAISNKLYYSALLYKPILVCENTFMEKISVESGFGYVLKMNNKSEKDKLYDYIRSINRSKLIESADKFMKTVIEQDKLLDKKIRDIFEDD